MKKVNFFILLSLLIVLAIFWGGIVIETTKKHVVKIFDIVLSVSVRRKMLSPIKTVFMYYPLYAFITITILLVISGITFKILNKSCKRNERTKQNSLFLWLLVNYSLFLLFFTVLGRRSLDYYRYNFDFGYSYQEIFSLGDYTLASQIIVNIFAFTPMGILCSFLVKKYGLLKSIFYGFSLSLSIEVMQLVLRRGYFEFDDMLSNTIGVLIGYIVGKILGSCVKFSFKGTIIKTKQRGK